MYDIRADLLLGDRTLPWVPQSVLDVLLDAARARVAGSGVSAPVVVEEAPLEAQRTPNPPAAGSTPALGADPLPEAVVNACIFYAFDDLEERAANFRRAELLHKAGKKPAQIVAEIKQGARLDGVFV